MHRIKVMHLIHQLGAGGAENGIINIVNHVEQNHIESAICAFVGQGSQAGRVNTCQTVLFDIKKKSGNDIGLPFRLCRLLKEWQPDILHTHAWGTLCEGVIAAKMAGVPIIVHGEHGTIQNKPRNLFVQRFFWHLVDQVLSVSEAHKTRLSKTVGFPAGKINVTQNGVDTKRFCNDKRSSKLKITLGLNQTDRIVGTVGRLMPVKNQAFLIKSFAKIAGAFSDVKLLLVGDGPLKASLASLTVSLGVANQVVFAGRRSDVPEVLNVMDIFVLPSLSEGMSNTILEAMSCGLPVIATDVGGNPGIINKEIGTLVPLGNLEILANEITRLINNPDLRRSMGLAGRILIEERYSLEHMLINYEELYTGLYERKIVS